MKYFEYSTENVKRHVMKVYKQWLKKNKERQITIRDFKIELEEKAVNDFRNVLISTDLVEAVDYYGILNAAKTIYGANLNSPELFDSAMYYIRDLLNAGKEELSFQLYFHYLDKIFDEIDSELTTIDSNEETDLMNFKAHSNFRKVFQ